MKVLSLLDRKVRLLIAAAALSTVLGFLCVQANAAPLLTFATTAVALAMLATLVGEGTDELGARLGPAATGILQSALGNLPELFIAVFSLQAGLVVVVQAALIGSILANSLLVLGLAFVVGGVRHGTQSLGVGQSRTIATLLLLAVAALVIPVLATAPGAPDEGHPRDLSVVVSVVLLVVFAASVPFSLRLGAGRSSRVEAEVGADLTAAWPAWLSVGLLVVSATLAAFVSDWFVEALRPAMAALGTSETFAGLVVVAIAGNAVENVVGIQAAARNQAELAVSLILNSSLQVAVALVPALVLVSILIGGAPLTLVVSPLLAGSVALSAILTFAIVYDGESNWLEGLALIGLYTIIAASVWWGPPVTVP